LFYRDDDELAESVSDHVLSATFSGGSAIVIATPAHRQLIEDRLERAGADIAAARAAGFYVTLDAAETLRKFLVGDWPSAAAFWQVISPLIHDAAQAGRPVHVFGEMVSLLWEAGLVNAAVDLEALWNELRLQYPFALMCAYSLRAAGPNEHPDALSEVCRVHAAVIGKPPDLA
jgi:hypothetical protein